MFDKQDLMVAGAIGVVGGGLAIWAVSHFFGSSNAPSSQPMRKTDAEIRKDLDPIIYTEFQAVFDYVLLLDFRIDDFTVDTTPSCPSGVYRRFADHGVDELVFISVKLGNMFISRKVVDGETVLEYRVSDKLAQRARIQTTGVIDTYAKWLFFLGARGHNNNLLHSNERFLLAEELNTMYETYTPASRLKMESLGQRINAKLEEFGEAPHNPRKHGAILRSAIKLPK